MNKSFLLKSSLIMATAALLATGCVVRERAYVATVGAELAASAPFRKDFSLKPE